MKQTTMTPNQYQNLAMRTCNLRGGEKELHALMGISSEIGELHGIYQKFYQGHTFDPNHVKKECGDILWFLTEYIDCAGWTLEEIMETNIEKLKKRYPDGFEEERSLHREKGDL